MVPPSVAKPVYEQVPSRTAAAAVASDGDDRLMAAFCAGDEGAFSALYERHATTMFRFLRRLVGQRELAEDVLQTTFLSVVRARGRYQPGTNVRSWFYAIAANAARDALRRARVRSIEQRLPADAGPAAEIPDLSAAGEADPALRAALGAALDALPADQREAVVLHHLEGLSFPEIADILGISAGAAKVRAHRGYERLRVRLGSKEAS
jgi:RNA polymerase sigma-70 factor (ECF subfamily)